MYTAQQIREQQQAKRDRKAKRLALIGLGLFVVFLGLMVMFA